MKNIILVTGGAGFVGSNLINLLIKKTKKKIISLDNYSSGSKKNHISNNRVKYLNGNTLDIEKKFLDTKNLSTQYFILENFQEFIKVLRILMNVINQILLEQMLYLNFA